MKPSLAKKIFAGATGLAMVAWVWGYVLENRSEAKESVAGDAAYQMVLPNFSALANRCSRESSTFAP
jgi:hypothetical protein